MRAAVPASLVRRGATTAALVAAVGLAVPAAAQVLNVPRRAAEATAPRAATDAPVTTLIFSGSAFAGYDDNVSEGGDFESTPGAPPLLTAAGQVAQFDLGLDYRRTRGTRGIGLSGRGGVNTYTGLDLGPSQNAALVFSANTGLGRSNTLSFSEMLSYDSIYGLDTLGAIENPVLAPGELPTSSAIDGLLRQRSWATATSVSLGREWGRRDTTSVGYSYGSRTFTGSNGETTFNHNASASHNHAVSRNAGLFGSYAYSNSEYAGSFTAGPRRPVASHNVEGGFTFTKRVTARRSVHVGLGGGASYVETVSTELLAPYTYWAPTASLDARLDLSQTWTLAANYRRTTTGFEGLSRETFISDVAGLSLGGSIGPRTRLVFSGGGARGNVDASASGTGEYTTGTGAVQVGVSLTRTLSAVAQYNYYRYSFSGDTLLPDSVPPQFSRNAIRAGLSLALPLTRTRRTPTMP